MTIPEFAEMKKARFFSVLWIARMMHNRTRADRESVLIASRLSFAYGWSAHDRYQSSLREV